MTNDENRMMNRNQCTSETELKSGKTYDLEERTAQFGEAIIRFAKTIPDTPVMSSLITQLVRAGTSVGANYCEADDAGSKKEFRYRISVCKRESRETKHWLRMIAAAIPTLADEARLHWREAKELHLIFAAILRSKRPAGSNEGEAKVVDR